MGKLQVQFNPRVQRRRARGARASDAERWAERHVMKSGFTPDELDRIANGTLVIYRYVPIRRLLEMLKMQKLPFLTPDKWLDPFEKFNHSIAGVDLEIPKNSVYSSCWTLSLEADHLWRLYTPNEDGVRISVRVHTLQAKYPKWQVRKIRYLTVDQIKSRMKKSNRFPDDWFINNGGRSFKDNLW
jgi:hypothetical protein